MALENGFVILLSKTYENSQIYINSNHFGQELIFDPTGKLEEGINGYSDEMQLIIEEATQNLRA